jgi:hypothetical protein
MTVQGGPQVKDLVRMRIRLRNRCTLPQDETRVSQRYGCTMTGHRFSIKCRSGSKKNKFLESLMTTSVRKISFTIGFGRLSRYTHVNQTYPDVVRMWRQFQGCPGSGVGIEWVLFSSGKQYDVLKKKTMDKTLPGKHIEDINRVNRCSRLVMTKESSPIMMTHAGK